MNAWCYIRPIVEALAWIIGIVGFFALLLWAGDTLDPWMKAHFPTLSKVLGIFNVVVIGFFLVRWIWHAYLERIAELCGKP